MRAVAFVLALVAAWAASPGEVRAEPPLGGGPLHIVVPYPPGGGSDRAARLLAEPLQARLGVPVVVENRTGAGGRLAAQQVRADTGGSTLLIANPAVIVVAPLVFKDVGYDPEQDFTAVAQVSRDEFALSVGSAVPVREVSHLLAWMKLNRNQANIGVPVTGSLPHFFALMLGEKAGVDVSVIGYRGSAPLLTDLIGGIVPVSVDTIDAVEAAHKGGKVRVLAVSGARRYPGLPDVPTFRESGIDLVANGWNVLFAPKSMPAARVAQIAGEVRAIMSDAQTRQRFAQAGIEAVSSGADDTARMVTVFRQQWAPVVRRSGFQP